MAFYKQENYVRLLTYRSEQELYPGLVVNDQQILNIAQAWPLGQSAGVVDKTLAAPCSLVELIAAGPDTWAACNELISVASDRLMSDAVVSASEVEIVAPIPRPLKNVFCVGSNYRAHVSEANKAQSRPDNAPKLPVFFTKPPTAVIGPGAAIRLDPNLSNKMDYEVELAVVIGKAGRDILAADARDHIFGFTIVNDVTARDLQRAHGGQYLKGKGLDTTCPMGPHIVSLDELSNFDDLQISSKVNGETRQQGNTGDMIFSISLLLESLSAGLTLEPGDILATGTPSGVGYAMESPTYLKDGDKITCEIEGIGQLENSVRNSDSSAFVR
jgi:2-keto-4-pentenoate hydratase/2-oxohepta-3-ene-1,7-dioic acid hydratase in catechol pathway